jgi:hypothetical protein
MWVYLHTSPLQRDNFGSLSRVARRDSTTSFAESSATAVTNAANFGACSLSRSVTRANRLHAAECTSLMPVYFGT